MQIQDFKKLVSDYMLRDEIAFDSSVAGQVDKLLLAANSAKAYAQRRMLFEFARTSVNVVVDKTTGGSLLAATDVVSGEPVRIRKVERAFIESSDGGLVPVEFIHRDSQIHSLRRKTENVFDPTNKNVLVTYHYARIVRHGNIVRVHPWDDGVLGTGPVTIVLDVVKWLPDYGVPITGTVTAIDAGNPTHLIDGNQTFQTKGALAGDLVVVTNDQTGVVNHVSEVAQVVSETIVNVTGAFSWTINDLYKIKDLVTEDFFLVEGLDWMLYRTIQELNLFLKEDQRVAISAAMMKDAWETVASWNSQQKVTSDELDLE